MPAYNEEEALPEVLAEWTRAASQAGGTVVVLNDGSKDRTLEVLRDAQVQHANLVVIDKENSGHGPTCLAGYKWAVQEGFEWVFQTDSDGQTRSAEFLEAWKLREQHDFIFGHRPSRGDGFARVLISKVLQAIILVVFWTYLRDANVPFRLMRATRLKGFLDGIPDGVFLANAYLTVLLRKSDERIYWFPISFAPRSGGIPSVSLSRFSVVGLRVVRDFLALRSNALRARRGNEVRVRNARCRGPA
jgi:glycosyltransferase involved in cell wall biosynthesis